MEMAAHDLIKKWVSEHIRIIFNGNGYSEAWVEEAQRRGLPNITNMVDAVSCLTRPESIALFEKHGVMTKNELASREEVGYETYSKAINIEARTMIDMAKKEIIPAVIKYSTTVAASVAAVEAVGTDASVQRLVLSDCSRYLKAMNNALIDLEKAVEDASGYENFRERALAYRDGVCPAMAALRAPADALETIVDEKEWPFPTYGELMFNV